MPETVYKIGYQFEGALMMALQKCLQEQVDIRELLREFNVVADDNGELVIKNPPTVIVDVEESEE